MKMLGLRSKALLSMLLACSLALIPAGLIGWYVLDNIHQHLAQSFVRTTTLLNRSKISAPLLRELALAQRFADTELLKEWLLAENDPVVKTRFFREAESYRKDFQSHVYFIGIVASKHYYINDPSNRFSMDPRHTMLENRPADNWFYSSLRSRQAYNINIDNSLKPNDIKIWFNIKLVEGANTVGVAGSGINLTTFLTDFLANRDPGVTAMIINPQGAIQAHPDTRRVAINSGASGLTQRGKNLFDLITRPADASALREAMRQVEKNSNDVPLLWVQVDGQPRLLGISYIPELKWHVVTLLDLQAAKVVDQHLLWPIIGLLGLLLLLVLGFALVIERVLLSPLHRLQDSAQLIANGQYDLVLPKPSRDEIGDLSRAFSTMAGKVRSHTNELEQRVLERTKELEQANREMTVAQKKISDSINYASLIQRAILPKSDQQEHPQAHTEVLWLPRDIVGGDFYLHRTTASGTLLGVVDCAGHGVPGAMMTMLAYAAIDQAIGETATHDPAAILQRADSILRSMLPNTQERSVLATNMDVGLAYIDHEQPRVTFAGAKMSLYMTDGKTVETLAASRRALADKRRGEYHNVQADLLPGRSFYLVSDGFLDQAGGSAGFGFGDRRFADMILKYAKLSLREQITAFRRTLAEYQGNHVQRDDITLLCFTRPDTLPQEAEHHDAV